MLFIISGISNILPEPERILEAVDYIRNNYDDCNLNVNQLADRLNISTAYFGQLFAEFTGLRILT